MHKNAFALGAGFIVNDIIVSLTIERGWSGG